MQAVKASQAAVEEGEQAVAKMRESQTAAAAMQDQVALLQRQLQVPPPSPSFSPRLAPSRPTRPPPSAPRNPPKTSVRAPFISASRSLRPVNCLEYSHCSTVHSLIAHM